MGTTSADPRHRDRARIRPRSAATSASGPVAVQQALRALLAFIALPPMVYDDEEVALVVELDEVRYTLIREPAPHTRRAVGLSAREQEIARLISAGHTNKTVAAVLEISLWTVDTHIRRIFAKLGVRSRSAMVARLAEHGLLAQGERGGGGPSDSARRAHNDRRGDRRFFAGARSNAAATADATPTESLSR